MRDKYRLQIFGGLLLGILLVITISQIVPPLIYYSKELTFLVNSRKTLISTESFGDPFKLSKTIRLSLPNHQGDYLAICIFSPTDIPNYSKFEVCGGNSTLSLSGPSPSNGPLSISFRVDAFQSFTVELENHNMILPMEQTVIVE